MPPPPMPPLAQIGVFEHPAGEPGGAAVSADHVLLAVVSASVSALAVIVIMMGVLALARTLTVALTLALALWPWPWP